MLSSHKRLKSPHQHFCSFDDDMKLAQFSGELSSQSSSNSTEKPVKKKRQIKKTPRQISGYNFRDKDGEYDVPIIDEPKWYRIQVRRSSEKTTCSKMLELAADDERWKGVIVNAFYPKDTYPRFKGNMLSYTTKPMIPGLLYIKIAMGPDIADDIEKISTIYGFSKSKHGIVLPLSDEQGVSLEKIALKKESELEDEYKLMKKEEYVSVIAGDQKGRYGILQGTKRGKLEVILRGEYKDEWELFNLDELKYLENPPEKKWKEMSAKEAIESLMAKDPRNPTVQALKKEGLLSEILYSEEGGTRYNDNYDNNSNKQRIRSIAKPKKEDNGGNFQRNHQQSNNGDAATNPSHSDDDLDSFLEGLLQNNELGGSKKSSPDSSDGSDLINEDLEDLLQGGNLLQDGNQDLLDMVQDHSKTNHKVQEENDSGPSMDDYKNFGDYLEAVVNHARITETASPQDKSDNKDKSDKSRQGHSSSNDGSVNESSSCYEERNLIKKSVNELKEILRLRGEKVGGTKATLIKRILQ